MEAVTPPFPFLKLPLDIRVMVYERIPREIKHINLRFDNGKLGLVLIRHYTYPEILATSKQVYAESIAIMRKTMLAQPPRMAMRFGTGATVSETASVTQAMINGFRKPHTGRTPHRSTYTDPFEEMSDTSELINLFEDYFDNETEVLLWAEQAALCLKYQLKSAVVAAPFSWWRPTVEIAILEAQGWEMGGPSYMNKAYRCGLRPSLRPTEVEEAAAHILDLAEISNVRVDIVGLCETSDTLPLESPGRATIHRSMLKENKGSIRFLPEMAQSIWQNCWLES
jgi:hypothetical protein